MISRDSSLRMQGRIRSSRTVGSVEGTWVWMQGEGAQDVLMMGIITSAIYLGCNDMLVYRSLTTSALSRSLKGLVRFLFFRLVVLASCDHIVVVQDGTLSRSIITPRLSASWTDTCGSYHRRAQDRGRTIGFDEGCL
jgi:hypothetical protein